MSDKLVEYKNPILWVPTSYFAEGTVYATVTTVSAILFKNMGLSNEAAAAYAASLTLPYALKPLWAPITEMFKTKKFFVVVMQMVIAAVLAGVALALPLPFFVGPVVALFWVCAFAGATQDIATDGVYVTTLPPKEQAKYTGFQSTCWSIGPIVASGVLVIASGYLHDTMQFAWSKAWMLIFLVIGGLVFLMALYHMRMLPPGATAADAPKDVKDAAHTFGKAFRTFFQKKSILAMALFAFFYRFGYGLLDKMGPLFLIDSADKGGLGLSNIQLGTINGTFGMIGFFVGSILGGLFVAKMGLKKVLFFLCMCISVPNLGFVLLSQTLPHNVALVTAIITLGWFGYGFGAVGHMLYMMQQIAPGPYKTAHYSFATGLMALCMMTAGMVSGFLQRAVGYQTFFLIALASVALPLIATWRAPFHHNEDGEKTEPAPA